MFLRVLFAGLPDLSLLFFCVVSPVVFTKWRMFIENR